MAFWINYVDRYAITFIDFWRLRPKRFIAAKNRDPNRYLSPYQFLYGSLCIEFGIYAAAFSLNQSEIYAVTGQPPITSANALAVRFLAYTFVMLIVGALGGRAVSRIWPVRGSATFSSIFEIQCYMLAIILPVMIYDLLIGPLHTALVAREVLPAWSIVISYMVGVVIGTLGGLFWNIPGVAVVNGVSTRRMLSGVLLWGAVFWCIVGAFVALVW